MSKRLIYVNSTALAIYHDDHKIPYPAELSNYFNFSRRLWFDPHWMHDRLDGSAIWNLEVPEEFKIPAIDPNSTVTFEEATNSRAREIEQYQETTGLPIIVYWSGGIDSTAILAAIIKNFKSTEHVTVALNTVSYIENPVFFDKFIRDKIKTVAIGSLPSDSWMNNIVINGEPADQMYINANILELDRRHPGCSLKNAYTDSDILIAYLASKANLELAVWAYEKITNSMKRAPVPISTYEDFFWWANYNFFAIGNMLKSYYNSTELANAETYSAFRKNFKSWYSTNEYNQWAMHNNSNGIKYNKTITSYKMPSKQYIWDLDHNDYYRYYKTKTGSPLQYMYDDFRGWNVGGGLAVFNDGTIIKTTDTAKIKIMLERCGFGSS